MVYVGLVGCSFHVYPVKKKNLASLYLLAGIRIGYSVKGQRISFYVYVWCFLRSKYSSFRTSGIGSGIPDIFIWAS